MPRVECRGDGGMIRIVVALDALPHLGRAEPARVHRHTTVRESPDEPDALLGLARRRHRPGPGVGEELGVDVGNVPVRIDVSAREQRLDQRRAEPRRRGEKLVDIGVLGPPHQLTRRSVVEVGRICGAAVRRVEHQRDRVVVRLVNENDVAHPKATSLR